MKYEHKGVEIEFVESRGTFAAIVNGKRAVAPSLLAIKSKIDKAQADTFVPFDAFRFQADSYHSSSTKPDKIVKFSVTGIEKAKGRRRVGFLTDNSNAISRYTYAPDEVILYTPENLKIAAEIIDLKVETAKVTQELHERMAALKSKLEVRKANSPGENK